MAARSPLARRRRGGDRIQAWHAIRLRLALIASAVAAACAVAFAPLVLTGSLRVDERLLAVVALAALVFPLLGVGRLLPWALAPLAACALLAAGHGDIGNGSIAVAAALVLLVAECASAAGDLAGVVWIERRLASRLILRIAAESAAACGLAALVLASGSLDVRPGLATLVIGLLATVALLGLVAGAVTRR